jgi:protein required for attachment to host cells
LIPVTSLSNRKVSHYQVIPIPYFPHTTSHKKSSSAPFSPQAQGREDRFKSLVTRNIQKVRHHFENKEFELIAEKKLNGFREKSSSAVKGMLTPQIHKWKTRCFTTQP